MKKKGKVKLFLLILVSFLTEVSVPNIAEGCLSQISSLPVSSLLFLRNTWITLNERKGYCIKLCRLPKLLSWYGETGFRQTKLFLWLFLTVLIPGYASGFGPNSTTTLEMPWLGLWKGFFSFTAVFTVVLYRTNDRNKVNHLERVIAKYFRDLTAYI